MLTDEQLAMRQTGVTATDIGAILGINPYRTALDVYQEKIGSPQKDISENPAVYWGVKLEPLIAERYAQLNKVELEEVGTVRHKEHSHLLCTPDRIIVGANKGLEIKTAGINSISQWSDTVPQHYFMQAAHCMFVLDLEAWDICVLLGGQDMRTYTLTRDKEFDEIILNVANDFWFQHVQAHVAPSLQYHHPLALDALKRMYPTVEDINISIPHDIEETIDRWQMNKEMASQYQKAADAEQAVLLEFMKDVASGELADGRRLKRTLVKMPAREQAAYEYVRLSISKGKKK